MKKSVSLVELINPEIKAGDLVKIIDGSGLSCTNRSHEDEDIYIICSYPELTGKELELRFLTATVVAINQKFVCSSRGFNTVFLQDVLIEIGYARFRTCSEFLIHVINPLVNTTKTFHYINPYKNLTDIPPRKQRREQERQFKKVNKK